MAVVTAGIVVAVLGVDSFVVLGTIDCMVAAVAADIEPVPELVQLQQPQRQLKFN